MASEKRLAAIQADPLRLAAVQRVKELDLNPHAVSVLTEGAVSHDAVQKWLKGTSGIASHAAVAVLLALGWDGRTKFISRKSVIPG